MADTIRRNKYRARWNALDSDFSIWQRRYRDLSDYMLPFSGRFLGDERNRGDRLFNKIYDSTGTEALGTLAAGLMAGLTSPARPWFRLSIRNKELLKSDAVKLWLNDLTMQMQAIFAKSNTYRALHSIYEELGLYGTACSVLDNDYDTVIHHQTMTAGEYRLATNYKGEVNTMYRHFQKSIGETVAEFGKENCSLAVQNLHSQGNLDALIKIVHLVEPRVDRDPTKRDVRNMPWRSCYFEEACENPDKYLRESGTRNFRVLAPRWTTWGGDVYGVSPAMRALGDVRQLQHQQFRKAQGIDFQVNPPLVFPTSAKNSMVDMLPGGVSFADVTTAGGVKSAFDVVLNLQHLLLDIQDVRQRINQVFYVDLFKMLAQSDRRQMTATEVAERHEEKLLMLGPVLERQDNELLSKFIDITFARMIEVSMVAPPPQELQGEELEVEFVSMLAQAQRAIGINGIDRFVMTLGTVAQMGRPEIMDKLNADELADVYGDMLGIDPNLITADTQVAIIRKQRADQQAQVQRAAMTESMAKSANLAAGANTDTPNALTDVMDMFSGY